MRDPIVGFDQLAKVVGCNIEKMSLSALKDGLSDYQLMYLVRKGAQSILQGTVSRVKRAERIKEALKWYEQARRDPEQAARAGLGTRA